MIIGNYIKQKIKESLDFLRSFKLKLLQNLSKIRAHIWSHLLWSKYYTQTWFFKNKWKVLWLSILALITVNIVFLSKLEPLIAVYFPSPSSIDNLETILITLGGALIGASVIAFSLVMFSMQVNIERMPHGLFFKFGKDPYVLIMFVAALISAIIVCFSSILLSDPPRIASSLFIALWGTLTIITFVIQAYERTLFLINPAKQLESLQKLVEQDLQSWERRAEKAKPLIRSGENDNTDNSTLLQSTHDIKRTVYMRLNPHGNHSAKNGIDHAFSFARRYAERGDYVVSSYAMQVIGIINNLYVQRKGKTFYNDNPWIENPFSSDDVVTHSLEGLRRALIVAIGRKDEQYIIQILQTFTLLHNIYLQIDYSDTNTSKTHANLASSYLSEAVISILPHNMTDVLMEGLKLMGKCASLSFSVGQTNDVLPLVDKIGVITATGMTNKQYYPVLMTGMQQLAGLTLALLQSKSYNLSFTFKTIKKNVLFVAEKFMTVSSSPLEQTHSFYLAPYYSFQLSNLRPLMANLANQVINADENSEDAKQVIQNYAAWSDEIYDSERKVLLVAIANQSDCLFHIIDWTKSISEVLIALSNAPACDVHSKEKLQKNASWLISNLSFVPDDQNSISAVANYQLNETLFEAAMTGYNRDSTQYMIAAQECLLGWAFKAGKYQLGWGILEHSLFGLAILALLPKQIGAVQKLKQDIESRLIKNNIPEDMLTRTARNMREKAATLYRLREYPTSTIEIAMKEANADELKELLEDLANTISPNSAN